MKIVTPASLRILLDGIIDYAGLFPPARLASNEALKEYRAQREADTSWILGRFICPVSRLEQLSQLNSDSGSRSVLAVSAIVGSGETAGESLQALQSDLTRIARVAWIDKSLRVEALEIKVPEALAVDSRGLDEFLGNAAELFSASLPRLRSCFWEIPRGADWPRVLDRAAAMLQSLHSASVEEAPFWGLKMRCGGLDAAAFPSVNELATVLETCLRFGLLFKATAGLHQPLPHPDPATGAAAHGFFNLFAGALLRRAGKLTRPQLGELLADENPRHFRFEEGELGWKESSITLSDISSGRKHFISFGSCSVQEPLDALLPWHEHPCS